MGIDPADGVEITAQNGRYGPYIKKGSDSRSLESEEQLFTVTLDEALEILAQPKRRRGQTASPPLRELGVDPVSEKPVVLKEGRFGLYVTDGDTNASLRKDDDPESLTIERAAELLQNRREAGPAKKIGRKTGARKAPAKKKAARPPRRRRRGEEEGAGQEGARRRRRGHRRDDESVRRAALHENDRRGGVAGRTGIPSGGYCVENEGGRERPAVPLASVTCPGG